jgi:hypothetical protein
MYELLFENPLSIFFSLQKWGFAPVAPKEAPPLNVEIYRLSEQAAVTGKQLFITNHTHVLESLIYVDYLILPLAFLLHLMSVVNIS